jgi:transglutaminase-like putative cysteine protease
MSTVRYRVRHETTYTYGAEVVHSHQLLHLVPRPSPYQRCLHHAIAIEPATFSRRDGVDAFGNPVTRVEFEETHRRLDVVAQMEVEVRARPAHRAADSMPWEQVRQALSYAGRGPSPEVLEAARFRHESPYVRVKKLFEDYGAGCFAAGRPLLDCVLALMHQIHGEFTYAPGETEIATPLIEVLETRRGVCQDYAQLMIACLRARGLSARYVSGYIRLTRSEPEADPSPVDRAATQTQKQTSGQEQRQTTANPEKTAAPVEEWVGAGQSHAWVSVYVPPFGWVDLDPTNGVRVGTDHITVAWGRDFGDVSPLRGVILGGGSHQLSVTVLVEPLARSAA